MAVFYDYLDVWEEIRFAGRKELIDEGLLFKSWLSILNFSRVFDYNFWGLLLLFEVSIDEALGFREDEIGGEGADFLFGEDFGD